MITYNNELYHYGVLGMKWGDTRITMGLIHSEVLKGIGMQSLDIQAQNRRMLQTRQK